MERKLCRRRIEVRSMDHWVHTPYFNLDLEHPEREGTEHVSSRFIRNASGLIYVMQLSHVSYHSDIGNFFFRAQIPPTSLICEV